MTGPIAPKKPINSNVTLSVRLDLRDYVFPNQYLCSLIRPSSSRLIKHLNDEEEVEGIDLHQQRYPWEGSDMDYLYDEVSISLDGLRSIFESRRFEITKFAMCQDSKSISADVGTNLGDIAIWEVGSRDKLASRSFKVWDLATCTGNLQASLASEYTVAVNRVIWSPDGGLLGVAYSKHIVHIYSYHGGDDLRNHLEIDAHAGNVNDLAFSQPNQELCVVTCGEDKTIKVWSAVTGNKLHTFEGHEAPVYSVCPHQKENIQFIFSTAVDGRIKAWLYDNMGSRVDYDAPGRSCTAMAYSADGTRYLIIICIHDFLPTVSMLKRPRTPPTNSLSMDYQTADSESVLKRPRPFGISDGVNNHPVNVLPVTYPGQNHAHAAYSTDDLPKTVSRVLSQGSAIKSMDFHPVQQTMLLVGTNLGDIAIWELGSRDKLASRSFKVWDLATCTGNLQASLASEYTAAVNRVIWSPDGGLLVVAYSKHIVHIYSYHGGDGLRNHLEIDAHAGNVNDLAFSQPNQELCVVTCGEDKTIKVWSAVTGNKLHTFEGHEAPVYSVCPHQKENIQFIFSTAVDGRIKAWLYDNMGSRVDYDAPGRSCTAMAYSADGTRLFSCGTSKEGESFIVEWNESEGAVKRTYLGLGKRSAGVVQFDTLKNKFLVAGDEFHVKFWDMDSVELLTTTNADGGLPVM
ncbi:hypothetical protein F2Q70_00037208 [Brassica cretica]|uniref:Anaphase-promoting complex subunit 4 WD40 domain-containing protein n=1 Tax=Brassica cretica TaxID=69181 RepID=A0A8S9JSQ0_BRACR|nr:hypothetical protein F2Q70_00037208 [Brassica cretica]